MGVRVPVTVSYTLNAAVDRSWGRRVFSQRQTLATIAIRPILLFCQRFSLPDKWSLKIDHNSLNVDQDVELQ